MILAVIIAAACLALFGFYRYRKARVKVPFETSYPVGKELDIVYGELKNAGFSNITSKEDSSGWLQDNTVTDVIIDGSSAYKKGAYLKADTEVTITYSSPGRIYVTDLLKDWENVEYESLKSTLSKNGFSNISRYKESTENCPNCSESDVMKSQ